MPGRVSSGPAKVQKPKAQRKRKNRALNAFAIAEKQVPDTVRVRSSRLGEVEGPKRQRRAAASDSENDIDSAPRSKRPRPGDLDADGDDVDGGSDSDGNKWIIGTVPSDEDSEIDSDEAFGESDEEKFASFSFRGSKSTKSSKKAQKLKTRLTQGHDDDDDKDVSFDLSEGENPLQEDSDAESDAFAADAIDLAAVLDQRDSESEDEGPDEDSRNHSSSKYTARDHSDEEDDRSLLSMSEDEMEDQNATNSNSLQNFVSGLRKGDSTKNSSYQPDSHEALAPSEYGVTARQKLAIEDLMPSVTDPKARKALRALAADEGTASKKGSGNSQRLAVPLPKRQQDRIDQAAAYDQSKKTLNRWIETVKQNRRAEHLSFPLVDPVSDMVAGNKQLAPTMNSKPANSLEATIQNILEESGMAGKDGKTQDDFVQEMEELEEKNMSVEEVKARRAELRRARDLLFREEIKARRIKKIKSKSFRRVHRKARQRDLLKDAENAGEGAELDEEELERIHRIRAEERMGARHRSSKWAKAIKSTGRAVWDDDARSAMHEMARREEELMKRITGKDIDADSLGEDGSEDEELDTEDENEEAFTARMSMKLNGLQNDDGAVDSRLSGLPFMKRAEAANKKRNDEAIEALRKELNGDEASTGNSEDEAAEASGRRTFGPQSEVTVALPPQELRNEFEEAKEHEEGARREFSDPDTFDNATVVPKTSRPVTNMPKVKKGVISGSATNIDTEHATPKSRLAVDQTAPPSASEWQTVPKKHKLKQRGSVDPDLQISIALKPAAETSNSQSEQQPKADASSHGQDADDEATSESGSDSDSSAQLNPLDAAAKQTAQMAQLFASNDDMVAADFAAEKDAFAAEEDVGSDAAGGADPDALPGWGSWVGEGLSKAEQRRQQQRDKQRKADVAKKEEARKAARQDRANAKVVVSEKRSARNAAYLADQLPHPFESRAQYERSMRLPIGQEWSTVGRFQEATKPRVLVKKGRVIAPMRRPLA